MLTLITILIFVFILSLIVFIHEFGHFIVARRSGVLVEEFGFGLPPRMIGIARENGKWRVFTRKTPADFHHTIYSINWLPLGGFVRLYGDGAGGEGGHINPKFAHLSLENKSVYARAAIMLAGVVMNILLAVGLYYCLLGSSNFVSERIFSVDNPHITFGTLKTEVVVVNIIPGSPADKSGIDPQNVLLRYRLPQNPSLGWRDFTSSADLINTVKKYGIQPFEIELENVKSGVQKTVFVTPKFDTKANRPLIGIQLINLFRIQYRTPTERALAGFMHSYNVFSYGLQVVGTMVGNAIAKHSPSSAADVVSGPVGMSVVVKDIIQNSGSRVIRNLLDMMALISLNLAFMNVLPFPALDGGRVAMLIPEAITGKRVNKTFEKYVNYIGFMFLMLLGLLVTIKDIISIMR